MKKTITILALAITVLGFEQQNARGIKDNAVKNVGCTCNPRHHARTKISIGSGITNPTNNNNLFGKSTNFTLDYSTSLVRKSGFSIGLNAGVNYFSGSKNNFEAVTPNPFLITNQISNSVTATGSSKSSSYFVGVGPEFNFHFANHFVFSPIFQVGFLNASQNEFKATQTTLINGMAVQNYTREYDLIAKTENKTSGLGFIPKARLAYMFSQNWGLWAEASYLLGPKTETTTTTFTPQGSPNSQGAYTVLQMDSGTKTTVKSESKFNAVGFNFGLVYGFGGHEKKKNYDTEIGQNKCIPIIKPQVDTIYCKNGKIHFYGRVYLDANGTNVSELKLTSVKDKQGNVINTDVKLPMKMVFAEPDYPFNFEIDKLNCGKDIIIEFETISICKSKSTSFQAVVTKASITIPAKRVPCCDTISSNNDDDDQKCENSPLNNGDFTDLGILPGIMPTGKLPHWSKAYGNPKVNILQGCIDNGFVELSGNKLSGSAIFQVLDSKIEKGKKYKITFAVKYNKQQLDYGKIRIIAFNGNLPKGNNHPLPQTDIAIIGRSPKIHDCGDWAYIEFPIWTANKNFESIAINAYTNEDTISSTVLIDNLSFCETLESDCKELEVDASGNTIIPTNLGAIPSTFSCTTYDNEDDYFNGNLTDLYGYDGTFSMYDQNFSETSEQCFNIGGELPADVTKYNCDSELTAVGITETCDDIQNMINSVANIPQEPHNFPFILPLSSSTGECPTNNLKEQMAYGGKDIIYVHGLEMSNIIARAKGEAGAMSDWPNKTEFYGNGYYKKVAEDNWSNHISDYKYGIYANRHLIVCYNSSQDAETAANSIMSQIRDAMQTGEGVVMDGADLRFKKDANGKPLKNSKGDNIAECFGKEYVIVSHSTGGLVSDIMLSIANKTKTAGPEQTKYGNVGYLSDRCKGHIAMHSALNGSNVAAVAVALVPKAAVALSTSSLLANAFTTLQYYSSLGVYDFSAVSLSDLSIMVNKMNSFINTSILVDLSPKVAQQRWSSIINEVTVPVLTVSGNHPTGTPMTNATKWVLKGLDDGVVNTESSSGRNQTINSDFSTFKSALKIRVFDMGIQTTRATRFYLDQHKPFTNLFYCNSSPYLSATGMVEPTSNILINNQYNNHYTFLQATDQHMMPDNKMTCFAFKNYPNTNDYWQSYNNEEELVTNNINLYNNRTIDPLIINEMGEYLKYKDRYYPKLTIKKNKLGIPYPKIVWKRFFIWKRTYHRLKSEQKLDMEYAYRYLFP